MAGVTTVPLLLLAAAAAAAAAATGDRLQYAPQRNGRIINGRSLPYYFAAQVSNHPYSFVNDFGALDGFDLMLTDQVCRAAGRQCRSVLTEAADCAFTDRDNSKGVVYQDMDYGGAGLHGGRVAGCPGYQATKDFRLLFSTSHPYRRADARWLVAPGNPGRVDVSGTDVSKYRIVRMSGDPLNKQCLRRNRVTYDAGKLINAASIDEAVAMVKEGKADVLMTGRAVAGGEDGGLEELARLRCGGDVAVIMPLTSGVKHWWDKAFRSLYRSGDYHALCKYAEEKFKAPVHCLPEPADASPELRAELMQEAAVAPATPLMQALAAGQTVNGSDEGLHADRLWVFVASGRSYPGYSYLDENSEYKGFTIDLIKEVCRRAKKRCAPSLTKNVECIKQVGQNTYYPGRGLQDGWFDACTGYYNTAERRNSFDLTLAYLGNYAKFQVKPGNPKKFDPNEKNMTDFVMVYKTGGETNGHCIHRLGKQIGKIKTVENVEEARDMVLKGEADVHFATRLSLSPGLETLEPAVHCDIGGTGLALPKGSEILPWWNAAFKPWYDSGDYSAWCQERRDFYKQDFPCPAAPSGR